MESPSSNLQVSSSSALEDRDDNDGLVARIIVVVRSRQYIEFKVESFTQESRRTGYNRSGIAICRHKGLQATSLDFSDS